MFMADTLSRATLHQPKAEGPGETDEVMIMHDTRSATEREVEQIDMLQNLAVRETTLVQIKEHTEALRNYEFITRFAMS
jgi:hypothetical protein